MKHSLVFFCIILFSILWQTSLGQLPKGKSITFKVNTEFKSYYPLDSIKNITLTNWKGEHILSQKAKLTFINTLKKYTYGGNYAHTKPGHTNCKIVFENGAVLTFYSNSESDIIIWNGEDNTFIPNGKMNFENF